MNLEMNSFQIPIAILLLVGHLPPRKTIFLPVVSEFHLDSARRSRFLFAPVLKLPNNTA